MNSSTRYKCRLGPKKAVTVREGTAADLPSFAALMQVTGARDEFHTRSAEYYAAAYAQFAPSGRCALLIASYTSEDGARHDLAAVMVVLCNGQAVYLYGASSNEERDRMPTYIVQWEAIRWAKARGARWYDMWGVPDEDEATLEAEFQKRGDGLWGVYGFKRGFGGQVRRSSGAWDLVNNPALYALYRAYLARRGGA
jgi:lipid II:glycine glycyltransferase (peptidoglycan interpeptide bridge formation enzyme)